MSLIIQIFLLTYSFWHIHKRTHLPLYSVLNTDNINFCCRVRVSFSFIYRITSLIGLLCCVVYCVWLREYSRVKKVRCYYIVFVLRYIDSLKIRGFIWFGDYCLKNGFAQIKNWTHFSIESTQQINISIQVFFTVFSFI